MARVKASQYRILLLTVSTLAEQALDAGADDMAQAMANLLPSAKELQRTYPKRNSSELQAKRDHCQNLIARAMAKAEHMAGSNGEL